MIKLDGKRVQKFTEHPDQWKRQFNRIKYPVKNDGVNIVSGIDRASNFSKMRETEEHNSDDEAEPKKKRGYRHEDEFEP